MADDKDDNGLKKAEEALKKAEKNPAFVGRKDSPKFKAAVKQLEKARANFEAAGGVSDATPAIIDPRGRGGLETPPAPTAPTSPSDQVRNAMVGMRPEGNLGELPQLPEGRPEAAGAGRIQTKAEVIAEDAKTEKRQARKANQAAKVKKDAAVAYAKYKRNLARAAQQAKDESEHIRSIREYHEKDMPSFAEGLLAKVSGGMTGVLLGTFKRERAASEAAEQEITIFKDRMKIQADIRKGAATARNERAAGRVSSVLSLSERNAISGATNVLTSIAFGTKLFEDGKNPLVGIGPNTNKDTPAQVRDWWAKTSKKAFAGNKKAQREMGAASSRIADRKERLLPLVEKDDLRRDNRNTHQAAIIASIPAHFGITTSQGQKDYVNSLENIMHLEDKLLGQIDANNSISSYFDAMQSLADNGGDKYSKLKQAIQVELDLGVESKALKNIASMKDWMSGYENELTSIEKNLSVIKNAENAVVKLKAEAAGLRGRGKDKEADEVDKQAAEAQRQLETILALSSHSDLKLRVGKDGRTETFVDGTNVKLITQRFTPDGRSVADVNYEEIDSLYRSGKITESEMKALIQDANETVAGIESNWRLSGGPATSPDTTEGDAMKELKYKAWKTNNPEEFAIVQGGIKLIVEKIVDEEISYAEAKLGVGLNKRQQQIMRSPFAKHMLLLWKADDDKAKEK